ncbi:hypothetical protein JAAARDRAFT_147233 [Jaapia argillacea MUCL 33604]|uniref:Exosome complex protein n=1 Tax=Jaapia argillacea MUCL 33604 TaxID=933084 RepID=A0A067QAI3_9AGAM|nr:hypothetical protein JAAARDRAFT_147233 [Jaapia argillacea MUCL 33604]
MAADANRLRTRLAALSSSLDDLSEQLEPLLSQTLPESLLPLETIQQAKLQVALPYLVYDLVFIYLKTKGIDPKTHPVIAELDRIRQYFGKIKNAEDPETRTLTLDKSAANRFIKHAITQLKDNVSSSSNEIAPSHVRFGPDGLKLKADSPAPPVKVTSKMIEREKYQRELQEVGSDQEEDLEMFDDESSGQALPEAEPIPTTVKGKGRATTTANDLDHEGRGSAPKRKRPAIDPFGGYGSNNDTQTKKRSPEVDPDQSSTSNRATPDSGNSDRKLKDKGAKRKARKAKPPT